ncbi:hypothetical protein [Nonomuraea jiangxiensis]|uniref:Recombinase zinc beta ribbon domain-containing protein n=1 Tax=Nonomuraea jiangxiensis TaxID=633440 RepID=A0A1G9C9K6_9ACTN|nr:hypothetical protein [Nonomuraea jiangxiensis]SDK48358.1 hypothetical protein SAMN05421869_116113 [Nonomuraea jiangxiensis]
MRSRSGVEVEALALTAAEVRQQITRRLLPDKDQAERPMYVGDDVLSCPQCQGPLTGGHAASGWYPDPLSASYTCAGPDCAEVHAPVTAVDQELQKLTARRLSRPAIVAVWRERRVTELDEQIETARAVLAWCRDKRGGRLRELVNWLFMAVHLHDNSLDAYAGWLADLVIERAGLSGGTPHGRPLADLSSARSAYVLHRRTKFGHTRRQVRRALGGRNQHRAYEAELDRLRNRYWDLLNATDWRHPGPLPLPTDDKALREDWGRSPTTMTERRRSLLLTALGQDQITLNPPTESRSRVRVISGQS